MNYLNEELIERLQARRDAIDASLRIIRAELGRYERMRDSLTATIELLESGDYDLLMSAAALLSSTPDDEDVADALQELLGPKAQ